MTNTIEFLNGQKLTKETEVIKVLKAIEAKEDWVNVVLEGDEVTLNVKSVFFITERPEPRDSIDIY